MLIFEKQNILYLLFILFPILLAFYLYLRNKKKAFALLGSQHIIENMIPEFSKGKPYIKFYTILIVIALLIACLANPQLGTTLKKAERKGVDLMIALDISNSMNSEDIQPSRLSRSKQAIIQLLNKLENDRIGVVVFAGNAYLQLPLTSDYGAAKLFVNSISTSDISTQGTAIGSAINLCVENFDKKNMHLHNKAIIVISDGENHEDDAMEAAKNATKQNIMVSTIGMGLPQGAPIPEYRRGSVVSYKKDNDGNVVTTRLNEKMLSDIAKAGNGYYIGANNSSANVENLFNKINNLEKASLETKSISDYETRFQYPLFLALLLIILEIFTFDKRNKVFNRKHLFGFKNKKGVQLSMIFAFVCISSIFVNVQAQSAISTNSGNKLYLQNDYNKAKENYLKALSKDSTYHKAKFNLANTQYNEKDFQNAATNYAQVVNMPDINKEDKSLAAYNLGNSLVKLEQYDKAIESYINSLKLDPNNKDCKYNLAYALKKLQEQQQNQEQNKDNKDNKDKNKDENKEDQDKQEGKDKKDEQEKQQDQEKQDGQNEEEQQQQDREEELKKKDAERMLKALENQEKNTLDKVKKKKTKARAIKTEKDW